ncbi:cation/H(+) symporter 13-like [Spinacia oleracea]|uniref:Cation/H(+) symporter 13-like n=1 Tax=Spinacia oleracea TaxID=3562 RepID=A0ABM3QPP3_SPIOL|nr:cation/H(+) symporter 13-like [Spinacia oleracea]
MTKMFGGFVIGLFYYKDILNFRLLYPPMVDYMLKTFSYLGFIFYTFKLGVESNTGALLKKVDMETSIIAASGFAVSYTFSRAGLRLLNVTSTAGLEKMILLNAKTFYMVTCNHVNEVGISNSELGRLACTISLVADIVAYSGTFMLNSVIEPLDGGDYWKPTLATGTYVVMFAICRPLVIHIISYTPEGGRVKDTHFLAILLIALLLAMLGLQANQFLAVFVFGFFLPEEPLSSILHDKLDAITSSVLFPIFCAVNGLRADFYALNSKSYILEIVLIMGAFGKFLGTLVSSMIFGVHFRTALALSIIMASKGFISITRIAQYRKLGVMNREQFTLMSLHILFFTGAFLPLVRYIYKPSSQYSTIIRQGVITSSETGTLQVLACIFKEENMPGILRLLQAFQPRSAKKPIPVIALQLIPITSGGVSVPIVAPLHEIQSSAAYRSNLSRCNRTVNALVGLEHKTNGAIRPQHYISVSSYASMHNDICNVSLDNNVSLLILPFHAQWTDYNNFRGFRHPSQPIRDVNKMVLDTAPCSIGVLIDRGDQNLANLSDVYRVAIFFIGGVDDQEALAYTTIFANNPSIRLSVIRLISSTQSDENFEDNFAINSFQLRCIDNERVSFEEVIVNDGGETTSFVVNMKDEIDLAVIGRYHEPGCTPLFGLLDRWCDYPELGTLGDMLVSPEFGFSILVVQERPQRARKYANEVNVDYQDD